ncbi:SWP1 [Mytilus coruscus]|uniref:Dolichyl-diphosphooligosaccharide--protein glycosyltransferase subunit 2 n=1 Tax=Mytilus coruscus TaxID=42192 RepID=A0A6J8C0L4_MYTCO|nr:SWP1 [Mytilus coruscus]
MAKVTSVVWLFAAVVVGQALTPSTFLTTIDKARLKSVFEAAFPVNDVINAHYSILGLKMMNIPVPNSQEACKKVTSLVDAKSVSSLYHASGAAKALGSCKVNAANAQAFLGEAIKDTASVADIFSAFFALKNLGLSVDNTKVSKALAEALKKDDSPLSYGYAFLVSAEIGGDVKKMFDSIEDIVAQADEVDEKYLQFEGGLYATALVIDAAYKLSETAKKAPTIPEEKVLKFANYFLSRKHVHQTRSAYHLLSVVKTLTENKYHIPVAVTLASSVAVSQSMSTVQVRVSNLMGAPLGPLTVVADSAKHLRDDAIVLSKKPFSAKDESLYEINFMESKPAPGFYRLTISATPKKADKRLLGTSGAYVEVKVTTQVSIENVEIGIADKDQTTASRTTKLQYPKKAANTFEADSHQKIIMKFQLKDKSSSKSVSAHQTFVKLTNQNTNQEIIFVAQTETSGGYKFDLDVGANAKEFGQLSGKYGMELIVGDAVIENPFSWPLADESQYAKKPEIKHVFREPEKRPPSVVSTVFTALVLLPLAILFICWMKIGANISNFPMSLSAVGFHVCLAGIFGLYYLYFTCLNMFDTVRYLGILAIPTFLFGNRLLSSIAAKRKGEKQDMDSEAANNIKHEKRSREIIDDETLTLLEEAWNDGLRSTKEKEKIKALGVQTNLSTEKIEVWIGNRRAKDRRGGVAPAYSKKKAAVRGPSAYTLFSKQFKQVDDMEAKMLISALAIHSLLFSGCCSMSIGKLNDTVDELQDDRLLALENTIRRLKSQIKNVTNSKVQHKQPVMFYARINRSTFTLQTLSTLVFETVILNIGEHYDKYDGVFVAPWKGIYLFSWTVSIYSSNYAVTELIIEGRSVSKTGDTDTSGGLHSASMTALTTMNRDEHAFIRTTTYGSTHVFYSTSNRPHSSFLGMLVYVEK